MIKHTFYDLLETLSPFYRGAWKKVADRIKYKTQLYYRAEFFEFHVFLIGCIDLIAIKLPVLKLHWVAFAFMGLLHAGEGNNMQARRPMKVGYKKNSISSQPNYI